jgi:hypothetical protein
MSLSLQFNAFVEFFGFIEFIGFGIENGIGIGIEKAGTNKLIGTF